MMRRGMGLALGALALAYPATALAQSHYDSPNIEARLWCPVHIEELYREMTANEQVSGDHGWLTVPAGYMPGRPTDDAASWQQNQENRRAAIDAWENLPVEFQDNIFEKNREEAEIMRRVAYGILTDWPAARPRPRGYPYGLHLPLGGFGKKDQRATGRNLLRATWRRWKLERKDFLKSLWAVTSRAVFDSEYREWQLTWGPDPAAVPAVVPEGYVTEEFNCTWFMSVDYGFLTDSSLGEGLRFLAAFVHEGHLFEDGWTADNTRVASHLAAEGRTAQAPYPTEMTFAFPSLEQSPYFTEDVYYYELKLYKWVRMRPRSAGAGTPRLVYDVKYPIWDAERGAWRYADAVVSSSPGPEFRRTLDRVREITGHGLQAGARLRKEAGAYIPEGQIQR